MLDWLFSTNGVETIKWGQPVSTSLLTVALIAIIVWSLFLYRGASDFKKWQRLGLALMRILVLIILGFCLLEPMALVVEKRTYPRRLQVLVDNSASMSIQDQRKESADIIEAAMALNLLPLTTDLNDNQATLDLTPDQHKKIASSSRLDLAKGLLQGPANKALTSLSKKMDVNIYTFGESPNWLSDNKNLSKGLLKSVKSNAKNTAIANALKTVAKADQNSEPAGVILFTDGIENTSSLRSDAVLRELGTRGIPVYPVAIGLENPDDVSIRNIVMQDVAFSGDRVPVRVQIKSQGYEKRSVRLSVFINDSRVEQRKVHLEGGLQFEEIAFRVDIYKKGAIKVDVVLDPFDDEVSEANNRVQRSIRVVNEKVNVLYIEGSPRWEFRYLQAILKRDPRINATFIASGMGAEMARNSKEYIERFPSEPEKAFKYDLVIMGDVNPTFFRDEELSMLEKLISERGASLLILCGAEHTPTSYAGTVIESLLPVRFDPDQKWKDVAQSVYPVLTPEGVSSMVMTLDDDPETNEQIWSRMSPLDRVAPFLEPKLAATVLVGLSDTGERASTYPLIAWQRYGTGKCMSIATDRLWRLRFKLGDKYHWRIWSQCIQFMTLSRLMGEHKQIRLETDRSVYNGEEQVRLYAHVLDKNYEPIQQMQFNAEVVGLGDLNLNTKVNLRPVQAKPGFYEGYFSPPSSGRYRLESNAEDQKASNSIEFQVAIHKPEMQETGMQKKHLKRIAELSGGRLLSPSELPKLSSLINSQPIQTTVNLERPLWDNWLLVILVVLLAGMEWLVRRRNDLP